MYELGVRHAMLTWNEENHLATGVAGDKDRGLTNLGKEFLDYMYKHHMVIDVSHLNIKSFYDVLEYMPHNIIASHSNAYTLSDHRRNLNDDQLRLMREVGGYGHRTPNGKPMKTHKKCRFIGCNTTFNPA